jgi:DNA repair exonuclease SbcCD nuclease subunit
MNYEIYISNDVKYVNCSKRVKFENGTNYCVNTNKEGKEYFAIPNPYINNPENSPIKQLFVGRIKDAITAIREGQGDVLNISGMFGPAESVYRFIDRQYGEELRQKTIEGWKNTEFGYSLKFGYLNSMSGSRFINKEYQILSLFEDQNSYIFFNTEEEAEQTKQEILLKAQEMFNKWKKVENTDNEKEYLNQYFDESIYAKVWYAMSENEPYKLEVVQAIKF